MEQKGALERLNTDLFEKDRNDPRNFECSAVKAPASWSLPSAPKSVASAPSIPKYPGLWVVQPISIPPRNSVFVRPSRQKPTNSRNNRIVPPLYRLQAIRKLLIILDHRLHHLVLRLLVKRRKIPAYDGRCSQVQFRDGWFCDGGGVGRGVFRGSGGGFG